MEHISSDQHGGTCSRGASAFNQPIGSWDTVTVVTTMRFMFAWMLLPSTSQLGHGTLSAVTDMSSHVRVWSKILQPAHWVLGHVSGDHTCIPCSAWSCCLQPAHWGMEHVSGDRHVVHVRYRCFCLQPAHWVLEHVSSDRYGHVPHVLWCCLPSTSPLGPGTHQQ